MSSIDFLKYGFVEFERLSSDTVVYKKQFDERTHLELTVGNGLYCLECVSNNNKREFRNYVFWRYEIETQEEFDFLLFKGRVFYMFLEPKSNANVSE